MSMVHIFIMKLTPDVRLNIVSFRMSLGCQPKLYNLECALSFKDHI